MAKINVYDLKRPYRSDTETKEFTDPLQPDVTVSVTLRGLSPSEQFAALDLSHSFISRYVGTASEPSEIKLPAIDGRIPTPSATMCMVIASLVYAQEGPEDERYSFEEFVGIAETMPNAFAQIQSWSEKLVKNVDPKA